MKGSSQDDRDDLEYQVESSAFTAITDSVIDTHSAIKVLAITVTAEIAAFLMFYVSKDKVIEYLEDSSTDIWIYGSGVVFVIGFLTVFAAYRLIEGSLPRGTPKYTIWLASTAAGLLNIGVFFMLVNFQMK